MMVVCVKEYDFDKGWPGVYGVSAVRRLFFIFLIGAALCACGSSEDATLAESSPSASTSSRLLSSVVSSSSVFKSSSSDRSESNVIASSSMAQSSEVQSSTESTSRASSSAASFLQEALTLYKAQVEQPVTQVRCVDCHQVGGLSGDTRLIFNVGIDQADANFLIIQNFVLDDNLGGAYLLTKVQGGAAHQGGAIFGTTSNEFEALQVVIGLITGANTSAGKIDIFDNVVHASNEQTLRRAALIIAGRLPSEQELSMAQADLPTALHGLMSGDGFHQFLLRGANDKLLTDAFNQGLTLNVLEPNASFYPALAAKFVEASQKNLRSDFYNNFYAKMRHGVAFSPLKLIAHVVEHDLPYTQILTANYTMANPQLAEIYQADVTNLFDSDDYTVFKPVFNRGQIVHDDQFSSNFVEGTGSLIASHGDYVSYPHAGILNEPAFLNRYPTTETNRNRARARWASYHFLGVDIEKSAARTSDPEALADTNNPTMNNTNCTVCHMTMDPIAASFQNYGDEGVYRDGWGGVDALPREYKNTDLYRRGDTWFSDVRPAGFNNTVAVNDSTYSVNASLQWLATQIIQDERFAQAAIKFWWPAIMAEELMEAPEVIDDENYAAQLAAFDAQNTFINTLAAEFKVGIEGSSAYSGDAFNLKDALTKMLLSPWFRAVSASETLDSEQKNRLAGVGVGRLLTPEELESKTKSLIGYAWGELEAPWLLSNKYTSLMNRYLIYYGGMDSLGITARARELNTLMANVALTQATSVACGAVVLDVNRNPSPILLNQVDRLITPVTHGANQHRVSGVNTATAEIYTLQLEVPDGEQNVSLQFVDPYWDENLGESTNLIITRITLKDSQGGAVFNIAGQDLSDFEGFSVTKNKDGSATGSRFYEEALSAHTGYVLWYGGVTLPVNIAISGTYTLEVQAWRRGANDYPVNLALAINDLEPYGGTLGEIQIRQQLVRLHALFLGETLDVNSLEIDASFNFIVETWQWRQANRAQRAYDWESEACDLPIENWWQLDMTQEFADPYYMQGTWISFLVYLMTDYLYLHE